MIDAKTAAAAKELFDKYYEIVQKADKYSYLTRDEEKDFAKACAIITCEIIQNRLGYIFDNDADHDAEFKHWEEIKAAIESM